MDDGQLEFNRSLNSGAKPHWKVLYLSDFMIADGTVLRAEYTLSSAEFKMKDPDRDMNQLGALPDLDTVCLRVRDTVEREGGGGAGGLTRRYRRISA
jgi:hypothetical protein